MVGEPLRLGIQSPPEAQPRAALHVQDGGLHKRVGEDSDFLWSRSPLSKVDDIRIPVLVAPRRERSRMRRGESEQIVAAMKTSHAPNVSSHGGGRDCGGCEGGRFVVSLTRL